MSVRRMQVIGLTGGIASGKSTVAKRLRERGVPVIDADQVARDVVAPGEPTLEHLRMTFGDEILQPDGALDRKALGAIVFSDPAKLAALNAITHPAIMARVGQRLVDLQREGHGWVVYEAALIIENGLSPGLSGLIAVVCDPETQVARIQRRDGLTEAEARKRLAAQTDNATREEQADGVLRNDGELDALLAATDALFEAMNGQFPV
ncbi:MAG: dephospho-CoA kinase [Myxococcota bacterium]|nr:dephospho-CoA kinase [Myxococcota bacterium]